MAHLPLWMHDQHQSLTKFFSGFVSWLLIRSGVCVACQVAVLAPALWTLDRTSSSYLAHLLAASWGAFLAGLGTTTRGFLSAPAVSALSGLVALVIILAVRGPVAMVKHWKENVAMVFAAVAIGYAGVYGSSFAKTFLGEIASEHRAVASERDAAIRQTAELSKTLDIKRHNADFSDPAFQNAIGTLRAFMVWRKAIGPDANCMVLITQPSPKGDRNPSLSAFYGVLITAAVVGSNCPNSNLANIGLNPVEAAAEEQRGLIPGVAIIHMPLETKGSIALYDALSNLFQTERSYTLPRKASENVIWIQLGPGATWNSDLFSRPPTR